ncbi:MAG TPA: cysteine-rich CWC family protein [Rhodocyclaceae bacterium]
METMDNPGKSRCSRCGAMFGCAMADGLAAPCWCTTVPAVLPVPGADARCLCPDCLRGHAATAGAATVTDRC